MGNDSGGTLTQIAVAAAPDRCASMVLTSCDAFSHFPPPLLRPFPVLTRIPGGTRAIARLFAATLPHASLVWIDDALTFSMLDQPDAVANAIRSVLTPASW